MVVVLDAHGVVSPSGLESGSSAGLVNSRQPGRVCIGCMAILYSMYQSAGPRSVCRTGYRALRGSTNLTVRCHWYSHAVHPWRPPPPRRSAAS